MENGIDPGNLSVLVNCQGEGTLTVSLTPTGMSFPLECTAEKVLSTYNQLSLTTRREQAFIDVEAPFGVKWSLTLGQ
ncbi:hypothetical protein AB0D99_08725 [Streptomyces sp. NPDC047971]|uniref:hypothetical protein n=1 Tax=Streptomyces sp. NPDC047971 TaxID=3154499 RepID=UPI00340FB9A3